MVGLVTLIDAPSVMTPLKRSASKGFRGLTMTPIICYTMYIMRKIIKKHDLLCPDFLMGMGLMLLPLVMKMI